MHAGSYAIFSNHRHLEDAISVDRIVKELYDETPSPVLFYKPQGVIDSNFPMLAEDTFLLVIMTAFQALLFSGRMTRPIKLTKLLMVVVPDENRKGNYYGIHTIVCMSQKQISIFVIHIQGNLLHGLYRTKRIQILWNAFGL